MAQPRNLEQLQRWLQAVITHPAGIGAGVLSAEAQAAIGLTGGLAGQELETVVLSSASVSSEERLAVYGNAYFARLLECMQDFFPVLVFALGEDAFHQLALGYLSAHPPTSYTLGRLADGFADFLEETRPREPNDEVAANVQTNPDSPSGSSLRWPEFLVDLARLEWTIDQIFDGPGVENEPALLPEEMQNISPEHWIDARLPAAPCLRLLEFRFPVNDYYTAYRKDESPPIPSPRDTYLALTRREYVVRRIELSRPQFDLLTRLLSGATVGEAISLAAESVDDLESFGGALRNWFSVWAAEGFFQRIESR